MTAFTQGHALIIGVGADLPRTVTDATGLADILRDTERCAYPAAQVQVLTEAAANREGILTALDQLAQRVTEDATLIFYFSGHGGRYGCDYYLMAHGYDWQNPAVTAVVSGEFAAKIAAVPAARKVILLDCCHAGGVGEVKGGASQSALPPEAVQLFQQGSGYVVIASSTEKEASLIRKNDEYSVFTGALIKALCGAGVATQDGYVRVADLAGYTREQVPQLTQHQQHPVLHFKQADNFAIAYYAAGKSQPKGSPFEFAADDKAQDALAAQVKEIEDLFVLARYDRAYATFRDLCVNYADYQLPASMILSNYSEFQNQVISGILTLQQQKTEKSQIAVRFQTCLQKFKGEFL